MFRRLTMTTTALMLAALAAGCGEQAKKEEVPPIPLGVNLLTNPSFEDWNGDIPTDWKLQYFEGPGVNKNLYGQSIDEKTSGNFAFYMRSTADVNQWMVLVQRRRVMPGYRLSFSGKIKMQDFKQSEGPVRRAGIYVRFYDGDGKRVQDRALVDGGDKRARERALVDAAPWVDFGSRKWQRVGTRVDIPKNALYAEIGLLWQMLGSMYFDDVEAMLEEPVPWKEIRKKYVNYYYLEGSPFPAGAVKKEDAFIEDCVKKLDLKVKNKVSYYYYPSDKKVQEILNRKSGHERPKWKKQELHTTKSYDDHEMIHMLLVPLGRPPFGLCEGAVFYVLGSWEGGRNLHVMAKELLSSKRLPALNRILDTRVMDEIGLSTTVPEWASFSIWLIDRYGIEKFMKLYTATDDVVVPALFNMHFKGIYGKDFEVMDRDWRLWLLRYQPKR